jgi:acyl-CoA reductase-like NAD-dependent aldehyde dehydrogenase
VKALVMSEAAADAPLRALAEDASAVTFPVHGWRRVRPSGICWFVRPTVILAKGQHGKLMTEEIFGPLRYLDP